jgi:hypothetical protein
MDAAAAGPKPATDTPGSTLEPVRVPGLFNARHLRLDGVNSLTAQTWPK